MSSKLKRAAAPSGQSGAAPETPVQKLTRLRAAVGDGPAPAALGLRRRPARPVLSGSGVLPKATVAPLPPKPAVVTVSEQEMAALPTSVMFFDPEWYVQTYPDVAKSGYDPAKHYRQFGRREGRNPNRLFDSKLYVEANPDVAALDIDPFVHFVMYGIKERRRLRP